MTVAETLDRLRAGDQDALKLNERLFVRDADPDALDERGRRYLAHLATKYLDAPAPAVGALVQYDTARRALAAARAIDEVKQIHDQAEGLRAYARIANDRGMETDAAEIRLRAERRLGEMLAETRRARGAAGVGPIAVPTGNSNQPPTLEELGIDRKLSSRAQKLAAVPEADFEGRLASWRDGIAAGNDRVTVNLLNRDGKARSRAERERDLAGRIRDLPDRRYGVILADPEWRFEPRSRVTGMDRAPENHYPTSPLEAIMRRDVGSIAAADCVLFLWATVPMLAEAFCVLDAWGFAAFGRDPASGFLVPDKSAARYVSSAAWQKYRPGTGIGLGHWFRVDHEILLIATRGAPVAPRHGDQWRSVLDRPASRVHSEKPECVAEMIEQFWPTLPKIELNRRGPPRPGWDAWGNEAGSFDPETGEILDEFGIEPPPSMSERPGGGDAHSAAAGPDQSLPGGAAA